ncbi:hypothetical protein IDH15_00305 [Pelagibacterales bacterium SAG-MED38]|nr:hypothetical protein [Pelagibacterales bacterium SAG-MED38]
MNFGKIKTIIFIGGGYQLYMATKLANQKKINTISIISKRHSNEMIKDNIKLKDALKKYGQVFLFDKLDKNKIKKIIGKNPEFLVFSISSPWIFDDDIIKNIFNYKIINSHGTRLPIDRGGGGFSWRILNQDKFGICLIHLISSSKIDAGEIIFFKEFIFPHSLKKPQDYFKFQDKIEEKFIDSFLIKISKQEKFNTISQPEYLSVYLPRLHTDTNGWIDWSYNNTDLFNFICAFDDPYNGASTFINDKRVRIKSVTWTRSTFNFHPYQYGIIYKKTKDWIVVAINSGSIIIEEVLNDKQENILSKLKVGDRFTTPIEKLESSKIRKYFTPNGLK